MIDGIDAGSPDRAPTGEQTADGTGPAGLAESGRPAAELGGPRRMRDGGGPSARGRCEAGAAEIPARCERPGGV